MSSKKQRALPVPLSINDLPSRDQRLQHLLDEERVSLGQLVDALLQKPRQMILDSGVQLPLEQNRPFPLDVLGTMPCLISFTSEDVSADW